MNMYIYIILEFLFMVVAIKFCVLIYFIKYFYELINMQNE